MRITGKLILVLGGLSIALILGMASAIYVVEKRHLARQAAAERSGALEKLARVCAESLLNEDELSRINYLKTFWKSSPPGTLRYAAFLDEHGRVLMHSDFLGGDIALRLKPWRGPGIERALSSNGALEQTIESPSPALRVISTPVTIRGKRRGTAAVAYDAERLKSALLTVQRQTAVRLLPVALIGLALSQLLAFGLAKALARPLARLRDGVRTIGDGELDHRIDDDRADELGDLAREVNLMGKKLGELDEMKESFLAQITHDLRSPLSGVLGYAHLLLMEGQDPLTDKQLKAVENIKTSSTYLDELIGNILDITKLEAGKWPLELKDVELKPAAEEVVELLRARAEEFGVALENLVPEMSVRADPEGLRRVLMNLVSNALKFTPSGGRVSISAESAAGGMVGLTVRDSGIGIPGDKLGSLFQKFFQVAETHNTVRPAKGTGLGLVICKQIVEAHGGRISVESVFKKGTTFRLTLPAVPSETSS